MDKHDTVFHDIGYTSDDQMTAILRERNEHDGQLAPKKPTRRSYGRPPVGEDGKLLNVNMGTTSQTDEDRERSIRHGDIREQELINDLTAKQNTAFDRGDAYEAALQRVKLDQRAKRRAALGRACINPTLPGESGK